MIYVYVNRRGERFERSFPMGKAPKVVRVDGKLFYRDLAAEQAGSKGGEYRGWPMELYAVGVHPRQIPEMQEHLLKHGAGHVRINPRNGNPIVSNSKERGKVLKALRLVDYDDYR